MTRFSFTFKKQTQKLTKKQKIKILISILIFLTFFVLLFSSDLLGTLYLGDINGSNVLFDFFSSKVGKIIGWTAIVSTIIIILVFIYQIKDDS